MGILMLRLLGSEVHKINVNWVWRLEAGIITIGDSLFCVVNTFTHPVFDHE